MMLSGLWGDLRCYLVAIAVGILHVAGSAQAAPVLGQGSWETDLKARDINGNPVGLNAANAVFYYDTALDITWLKDWTYERTRTGTDATGQMFWADAMAWADTLTVGALGDWRLPTVGPSHGAFDYTFSNNGSTDIGYAKTGTGWGTASEYGHMYYVTLGNKGLCMPNDASPGSCEGQSGSGLSNTAEFINMEPGSGYFWSGTEYTPVPSAAFFFYPVYGEQFVFDKNTRLFAVAVRPGDVAAVPEPMSVVLLLAGLGVLGAKAGRPN